VESKPPEQSVTRLSLRNKLLLFAFALVALPGVLLGWLAVRDASTALEAQVGRALAREASHTANHLSSVLRGERQTLDAFARQDVMRDIRVGDVDKRVSMALAALSTRSEHAPEYFVVVAAEHTVAASAAEAIGDEALPSFTRAFLELGAGERIAGPLTAPYFSQPQLAISTPIPDPDDPSRELGTLYGLYDWAALTAVARSVRGDLAAQGVATEVLVASAAGALVGRGPSDGKLPEFAERSAREVASGASGEPAWIALPRAGALVGRAPLDADLPAWRVLVIQRRDDVLAPVANLQRRMALSLGVALAAALLAAGVASRRVVRPLSELTEAIRKLARRESGAPLSVRVRSDDELGALAGAFNRMSADLERAERELVEAEKFAFVGELAAGVAHEIRTSLGVLKSSSQILDRSLPADANDEVRELAQMVREEVARLGGVVDDLLTLKPERVLRLETGPLSPLLARAAEFASHPARAKRVRIVRSESPGPEPLVAREPDLIYQVAVNLLVNAVQALPEGGTIELALLPAQGGFGGFEVRDDGPGIAEELRERVFQPFVTGRSGGVGLGLTFVKRVVHEHRGRVAVAAGPGGGTRVRVELPLAGNAP